MITMITNKLLQIKWFMPNLYFKDKTRKVNDIYWCVQNKLMLKRIGHGVC